MTQDLVELTLSLMEDRHMLVQCPMCMWDNEIKNPIRDCIFSCEGCTLELQILELEPLKLKALSEWFHYYGGS